MFTSFLAITMISDQFVADILTSELTDEQLASSNEILLQTTTHRLFKEKVPINYFWISEEKQFKINLMCLDEALTLANWDEIKTEYHKLRKRLYDQWYYLRNVHPRRIAKSKGLAVPLKKKLKDRVAYLKSTATCLTIDSFDVDIDMDESTAAWLLSEIQALNTDI